eukprot:scaffold92892_cov19-Prasinocladus_malaysianus.AAC.1
MSSQIGTTTAAQYRLGDIYNNFRREAKKYICEAGRWSSSLFFCENKVAIGRSSRPSPNGSQQFSGLNQPSMAEVYTARRRDMLLSDLLAGQQ